MISEKTKGLFAPISEKTKRLFGVVSEKTKGLLREEYSFGLIRRWTKTREKRIGRDISIRLGIALYIYRYEFVALCKSRGFAPHP